MSHFLESIGYNGWILHALIVLPLIGVVPVLLGDERSDAAGFLAGPASGSARGAGAGAGELAALRPSSCASSSRATAS